VKEKSNKEGNGIHNTPELDGEIDTGIRVNEQQQREK
jgi:hypothetical protein